MGSATIAAKKNRTRKLTTTANGSITIARHSSDQITDIGGPCARIRYFAQTLWLMAPRRSGAMGGSGVEKGGVVAIHFIAGCPGGQSRKNVLAHGGVCVLIHRVNTN
jgi:hypothetical protein